MTNKTIHQVISEVLSKTGKPMAAKDIYDAIIREGLYNFRAKDPANIVRSQLRKHCENVKSAKGPEINYFRMTSDGLFELLT